MVPAVDTVTYMPSRSEALYGAAFGLKLRSAVSVNNEVLPPGYDGFYRQGSGDLKMPWNPHET